METASGEENREEEVGSRSSEEEAGLSPVAMATKTELIEKDVEVQTALKQGSPTLQHQGAKGVCVCEISFILIHKMVVNYHFYLFQPQKTLKCVSFSTE